MSGGNCPGGNFIWGNFLPFLAFLIILIIFFPEVVDERKRIYFFKQFLSIILWLNDSPMKQKITYAVFS